MVEVQVYTMSYRGKTVLRIVLCLVLTMVLILAVSRRNVNSSVTHQLTRSVFSPHLLRSPGECEADLLIGVVSPADGRNARLAVRHSWGAWAGDALTSRQEEKNLSRRMENFMRKKPKKMKTEKSHKSYSVRILFLVSKSPDTDIMLSLDQEADTFRDLIISNNPEGYSNLPLKTLTLMDYYLGQCGNSRYLLKVDDDVFLRVPLLVKYLEALENQDFAIGGRLNINQSPSRKLNYKYSVSKDRYSLEKYPPFLSGFEMVWFDEKLLLIP